MSPFDNPEFWNSKNRSPDCFNPPAARTILPLIKRRTDMVLAGARRASQPQFFTDDLSCSDAKERDLSCSPLPSVSRGRSIGNAVSARTLSFP